MDATLRIHIGLSVDASADRLFEPIEKAASRARDKVRRSMTEAADGPRTGNPYRDAPDQAEKAARKVVASEEKKARAIARINEQLNRELQRESERASARASRAADQEIRRNQRIADASALRMSGGAVRDFGRGASAVAGLYGGLAKSAGVTLDPSSLFQRNIDLEKRAVDLSNAGYMPGAKGAAGKRQDPTSIIARVRSAAESSALDTVDTMKGVQSIVGMTGDLEGAIKLIERLGPLARASGTSVEDMAGMAGQDAKFLDDMTPDKKTDAVEALMRTFVAQGKSGTVESKDLAKYAGKFIAQAGAFKGDFQQNAGTLGALAQLSMKGGASTAAEAANSVAGLANTLKTPARLKKFKEAGIDVYDKETGQLNSVESILTQSLTKTKGDPEAMKKLFANVMGERAIADLSNTWRKAERAQKGTGNEALRSQLAGVAGATMSDTEIKESFAASMNTTEAKAKQFQIQLEKSAQDLQAKLQPSLERLAPMVLKGAEAFGNIAGWAAENPFKAAGTLLGASIAKNLTQEIMRAALERALFGGLATSIGPGGAANTLIGGKGAATGSMLDQAKGMGAIGLAGTALAIGAMSVAAFQVGTMMVDNYVDQNTKEEDKAREEAAKNLDLPRRIKAKEQEIADAEAEAQAQGVVSPEDEAKVSAKNFELFALYEEASKNYEDLKTRVPKAEAENNYFKGKGVLGRGAQFVGEGIEGVLNMVGVDGQRSFAEQRRDRAAAEDPAAMRAGFEALKSVMNGELKVRVVNPQALQAPKGTK